VGSSDSRVPPVSDSEGMDPGAFSVLGGFPVLKVFPENDLSVQKSIS
jgi:hypothetical protein